MSAQEACKRFGIEYQTARKSVQVCRSFDSGNRLPLLGVAHHLEVAGRDDKAELLAWAMTTERKASEMLAAMQKIGHRPEKGNTVLRFLKQLESLGITKMQSSRWQKVTP